MQVDTPLQSGQAVRGSRASIAEAMVARHWVLRPDFAERYGERGRARCLQDSYYHLDYLAESLELAQPELFWNYLCWARVMLAGRQIPVEDLVVNMECLREAIQLTLPSELAGPADDYIASGLEKVRADTGTPADFLTESGPHAPLARQYLAHLLNRERHLASKLILDAAASGVPIQEIYLQVFQPCQREIGRLWQTNQISVAQEHLFTAATQLIMSQLYPRLFGSARTGRTLVATCASGDLHEIGVRMVADLFELNGWDTFYLGANMPASGILQMVRERHADVLAISATIMLHLPMVAAMIDEVRAAPDCKHVRILVGGYPFNIAPGLWRRVGADGCARDAAASVELANRLMAEAVQ